MGSSSLRFVASMALALAFLISSQHQVIGFQIHNGRVCKTPMTSHGTKKTCLYVSTSAIDLDAKNPKKIQRQVDKSLELEQQKLLEEAFINAKSQLEKLQATQTTQPTQTNTLQTANNVNNAKTSLFTESKRRSVAKSMMWRFIAGLITLTTSLRFSGSLSTALSIVGSDFFSKAATMFIGERLMNKSQAGRKTGSDDVGRSLAKALIWRLFAMFTTLATSFVVARDFSMASKIAGLDAVVKTSLMFVYERVWAKVEWGKRYDINGKEGSDECFSVQN